MPRRPTLSPSKLSCYLACPHKYYWTYESQQGQWFLRSRGYFSFGLSLHRALQEFHKTGGTGIATTGALLSAFEENWLDAGYGSADEMQAAFGEGKAILTRYAEEESGAQSAGTVIHVEKNLKKSMGEWDLVGRADRIDELDDAGIEVVDYKSGRSGVTEEIVATDIAMSAYALMVQDLFPERPISARIIALRGQGPPVRHRFSPGELSEFEFSVRELGDTIRNHYWEEFRPIPKALCATCEFLTLCKRDPEFAAGILAE